MVAEVSMTDWGFLGRCGRRMVSLSGKRKLGSMRLMGNGVSKGKLTGSRKLGVSRPMGNAVPMR